ncbi:THAP domain-containing protein 4-like [Acyrthosiphon pisum]|uniref:THAP-type domain-containing protein n=1 Tax=Acyrthosiphon pisum TaxID=7029 RepID=A0A8R2D6Y9_ACYPI|nr:THAP domain-containing protein 4-like [Acyrthosiphon pisum]|eukprot:XP_016664281.1 PREDICTED: THAP domain-containing protein 4-like [Acyrthosiphon pisum]
MATPKSKGGSCCAVASCKNYSGKAKNTGRTDLSFHRFPKDDLLLKVWSNKCRRNDVWNPSKSFICSDHFKEDDYVRDLKSELLGYAPRVKILKTNATPSLNLPDGHDKCVSESGIQRQKRRETKIFRQAHDEIITLALNDNVPSSSTQHSECDLDPTQSLGLVTISRL